MATLAIDAVLDQAGRPDPKPKSLDETELDPVSDAWSVKLWNATADLFCCRYFHRVEGSRDSMGRMRPSHIRHCVIGSVADQAATKVMAGHFCATVRRLAREHSVGKENKAALRRSFEAGCAARLAERLRRHAESFGIFCAIEGSGPPPMPSAADQASALEALEPSLSRRGKRPRRTNAEMMAQQAGSASADGICLVVRLGEAGQARRRSQPSPSQTTFGF